MDAKVFPASAAPAAAFAAPWRIAADAVRQQVDFAAESASVLLRGLQELGGVHSRATRDALDRQAAAARRLHGGPDPVQLATLPFDTMAFDLQGVAAYWQQVFAALLETQARLLNCGMHLVDTGAVLEAAAAVEAAQPVAAAPRPRRAARRKPR